MCTTSGNSLLHEVDNHRNPCSPCQVESCGSPGNVRSFQLEPSPTNVQAEKRPRIDGQRPAAGKREPGTRDTDRRRACAGQARFSGGLWELMGARADPGTMIAGAFIVCILRQRQAFIHTSCGEYPFRRQSHLISLRRIRLWHAIKTSAMVYPERRGADPHRSSLGLAHNWRQLTVRWSGCSVAQ